MLASYTGIRHLFRKCLSQYSLLRKRQAFLDKYMSFTLFGDNDLSEFDEARDRKLRHEFEVQHGNEDTFREMLHIKRSVTAKYSQTHIILPEYMMQKDTKPNIEEAMDAQKKDGIPGDEMPALERKLVPSSNDAGTKDNTRRLGFVSAGVESQTDGVPKVSANNEDIELRDESDSDDDGRVEITQKDIPEVVYEKN